MRQFITNNEAMYQDIQERAKYVCIRYRDQKMPPGSNPERADIGFEIDESGIATLLVSKHINYDGLCHSIREWFDAGKKSFTNFDALREWIQHTLAPAFGIDSVVTSLSNVSSNERSGLDNLTDVNAVRNGIREIHKPMYLSESSLFGKLSDQIFGQDDALQSLVAVVSRHVARKHPSRPAVTFSVGPSGVGKTRTAEVVARELGELGEESRGYQYLRLDMSEYQEAHRVSQLIGAPQGYVGHGEGSQLVEALRSNPRTVVLFDEIEKAHPAILRVLMNTMDAGRLSVASGDTNGWEIDCRHCVFIFTSNLNAREILEELESRDAFGNRAVEDDVCRRRLHAAGVAPEIIGRIGRFLVYKHLKPETRAEILALAISETASEYGLNVEYIEPTVIVELMRYTGSDDFGARPEKYMIDDHLGGIFAEMVKSGDNKEIIISGPPFECKQYIKDDENVLSG